MKHRPASEPTDIMDIPGSQTAYTILDGNPQYTKQSGEAPVDLLDDVAMLVIDADLHIVRFTASLARMLGLQNKDIGKSIQSVSSRLNFGELSNDIAGVIRDDKPMEREVETDDLLLTVMVYPSRTEANEISGAIVLFVDISGTETARQKQLSEVRFNQIFEQSPLGIALTNREGRIVQSNQKLRLMFGYSDAEMKKFHVMDLLGTNRSISEGRIISQVLNGQIPYYQSDKIAHEKNGDSLWVNINVTVIHDTCNQPVNGLITISDISARKHFEKQLQQANTELEKRIAERTTELETVNSNLLDEINRRQGVEVELSREKELVSSTLRSIGEGVVTTDVNGKVILLNDVAEELTGWRRDKAVNQMLTDVLHIINEGDHKPQTHLIQAAIKKGIPFEQANRPVLLDKQGREMAIEYKGTPVRDARDRLVGTVLVFRDVTEKRKLEEERQKANKLESIGFLAGGIAHDFNNLLTAIVGNISLARMLHDFDDEIDEILTRSEQACQRAKNLTNQLLTFSQGGAPLKKVTDLKQFLREVTKFVTRGTTAKCQLSFSKNLYAVEIDREQFTQVINNLVINSIQAMPDGGVIKVMAENIAVSTSEGLPLSKGDYVRITVRDEGKGIAKEHLDKVFDPYFTTKNMGIQKGCGLGLATAPFLFSHV